MLILCLLFSIFSVLQGSPTPASHLHSLDPTTTLLFRDTTLKLGQRQLSDIVLSCLATIFACTWTAIHPNIPGPTDSGWVILKRRITTTFYALIAPELIMYWAMQQFVSARRIARAYNEEVAKLPMKKRNIAQRLRESIQEWLHGSPLRPPLKDGEVRPWTVSHGFFIQMGGFLLCDRGSPIQVLPWDSEDFGLKTFIVKGIIDPPTVTEAEIKDRSKGDFISKTIVVLQTTWFVTQCIARWATKLSLTELEIVTLGFALLNGITYFLWWNKPQSVGVPVFLEMKKMIAENDRPAQDPSFDDTGAYMHAEQGHEVACDENDDDSVPLTAKPENSSSRYVPLKKNFLQRKLEKAWNKHSKIQFWLVDVPYRLTQALLSPIARLLGTDKGGKGDVAKNDLCVSMFYTLPDRISDAPLNALDGFLIFISALFGAVHLIPSFWIEFPTTTELWIWRISSLIIIGEPIITVALVLIDEVYPLEDGSSMPYTVIWLAIGVPTALGVPVYIFARGALLILALLSLRRLPSSSLDAIDWISYIPHI